MRWITHHQHTPLYMKKIPTFNVLNVWTHTKNFTPIVYKAIECHIAHSKYMIRIPFTIKENEEC